MNHAEAYVKFLCQWLPDNCLDDMEFMADMLDETCINRLRMVGELIGGSQGRNIMRLFSRGIAVNDCSHNKKQDNCEVSFEWGDAQDLKV
ncbi:asparagine--trna ligase [Quercus suber]|uniref:Asparagine--trna ligase n=1 Tax=Quercus suber TaxID=58331 RepID=A0AAW0MB43_QUESU